MNVAVEELAAKSMAFAIAPAGCGKTESIIDLASLLSEKGKQLILTHTHAGVDSLKKRALKKQLAENNYDVFTIDGFCREWVYAYPSLSNYDPRSAIAIDWPRIRQGFVNLLQNSKHIRELITLKWEGLIVDEYQDCSLSQHESIMEMAKLIPCRILGDPLQGLYDFDRSQPSIDWSTNVASVFEKANFEEIPARWIGTAPEMGAWLLSKRSEIINQHKLTVTGAPQCVTVIHNQSFQDLVRFCIRFPDSVDSDDSILILHHIDNMCHHLASRLSGRFRSIEELACDDLVKFSQEYDLLPMQDRFEKLIQLIGMTSTGMSKTKIKEIVKMLNKIIDGKTIDNATYRFSPQKYQRLAVIKRDFLNDKVLETIQILCSLQGVTMYRRELLNIGLRSFSDYVEGKHASLQESVISQVNQYRSVGRFEDKRIVGRIRLIKGLEYDHVIVVDFQKYNNCPKEAYVALTRAKKSLTILTTTDTLTFKTQNIPEILLH